MTLDAISDATILVVDDSVDSLSFMVHGLSQDFEVKAAVSGEVALTILRKFDIDVVVLDLVMPNMTGFEVLDSMRSHESLKDVPVIVLTGKESIEDEKKGFELGASDYIHKPVSIPLLNARVKTHLQNKRSRDLLSDKNGYLEKEVNLRIKEFAKMQDAVVFALASLAETRDPETGNHILRTQNYVKILAEELSYRAEYATYLTHETITTLYKAAPLHDIGKVGIEDSILLKPGKLTDEEYEVMKRHSELGLKALEKAEQMADIQSPIIRVAKEIAYGHHEKWDGTGYPNGFAGHAIPLSARLMALADVYDALRCRRVYKDPMSHETAKQIILEGSGSHFDPEVVDAFLKKEKEFISIAANYSDE